MVHPFSFIKLFCLYNPLCGLLVHAYQFLCIIYITGQLQLHRQEDIRKIVRTPAAFVDSRPFRLYKRLVDTEMEENFDELIIDGEIIKSVVRCKQCYLLLAKPIRSRVPLQKHLETVNYRIRSENWGRKCKSD